MCHQGALPTAVLGVPVTRVCEGRGDIYVCAHRTGCFSKCADSSKRVKHGGTPRPDPPLTCVPAPRLLPVHTDRPGCPPELRTQGQIPSSRTCCISDVPGFPASLPTAPHSAPALPLRGSTFISHQIADTKHVLRRKASPDSLPASACVKSAPTD